MASRRRRFLAWGAAVIVIGASALAFVFYERTHRSVPVRYEDPVERFKYGSIGTEGFGLPTYVFEVLPELCPDKFPGGYERLGWNFEPGKSVPIGLSQRDMGVMRIGFNCATCHVGTYRESRESPHHVVLGMPPQTLDFQKFLRQMGECVLDPRFTPDAVMALIEKRHPLSAMDAAAFRYAALPEVVALTRFQTERHAFFNQRPDFGPGRFDALNFIRLDLDLHPGDDDRVGVVDYPAVWDQAAHKTHFAQWDGSNPLVKERNRIAALLAAGGDIAALDEDELLWLDDWLLTLPVPAYPFPVDEPLARKGEPIFEQRCARCHAATSSQVGHPTPLEEIGTDPNRTVNLTPAVGAALNSVRAERWQITHFLKTGGYQTPLLDGLWARAPYLHNGSVPNVRELLEKPENRSRVFYRGYDVYDPVNLGFVSSGPDAEEHGFKFDTTLVGNSNSGHLYGTDLRPDEKLALIEFLKLQDKNVKAP
jgi:RoxA-like, cytochrome c-like